MKTMTKKILVLTTLYSQRLPNIELDKVRYIP